MGLLPILLATSGLSIERVGIVVAVYPMVWAVSQLLFGPMSDRLGRRGLIVGGLIAQGVGVGGFAVTSGWFGSLGAAIVVGIGTGMVYPTLLAFVSDISKPERRASALGVYRFWRDLGYAAGALGGGLTADLLGLSHALYLTAVLSIFTALAFAAVTGGETP